MTKPDVSLEFLELFKTESDTIKVGGKTISSDELDRRYNELEVSYVSRFDPVYGVLNQDTLLKSLREKAQAEWESERGRNVSGEPLEKIANVERKKLMLKGWVASELAVGRSVEELAAYAERRDTETAALIREVGNEIESGIE